MKTQSKLPAITSNVYAIGNDVSKVWCCGLTGFELKIKEELETLVVVGSRDRTWLWSGAPDQITPSRAFEPASSEPNLSQP